MNTLLCIRGRYFITTRHWIEQEGINFPMRNEVVGGHIHLLLWMKPFKNMLFFSFTVVFSLEIFQNLTMSPCTERIRRHGKEGRITMLNTDAVVVLPTRLANCLHSHAPQNVVSGVVRQTRVGEAVSGFLVTAHVGGSVQLVF